MRILSIKVPKFKNNLEIMQEAETQNFCIFHSGVAPGEG